MRQRRFRLGIRAQLTLAVLLGAVLTTLATLFIARNAIHQYALDQATSQQKESMSIAALVLETAYGQNISVSSTNDPKTDNKLVVDSPQVGRDQGTGFSEANYGKYVLNDDTDYVDAVKHSVHGEVSVFQCADKKGNFTGCHRVSSTFLKPVASDTGVPQRDTGGQLCQKVLELLNGQTGIEHTWIGQDPDPSCGTGFFGAYRSLYDPSGKFVAVLYVGEPLDQVTTFENRTTVELGLLGVIVLAAGIILALLFASAIINTLQQAARQVSGASERIGGIATQQAGGAAQQVWAVNAVSKALQNFQEMARDIAGRTDQLALMGNQVIQRRGEISPTQIDSILAYMTRSVRDISGATRQQAAQYERMAGAMQAVIEIAEQVAGNAQQSTESADRLGLVVRELQRMVGVRIRPRQQTRNRLTGMNGQQGWQQQQMGGQRMPRMGYSQPGGMPPGGMGGPGYGQQMGGPGYGQRMPDMNGGRYPNGAMPSRVAPGQSQWGGSYAGSPNGNRGGDWQMPAMPPLPQMPGMQEPGASGAAWGQTPNGQPRHSAREQSDRW
jgi:hypothetical protein